MYYHLGNRRVKKCFSINLYRCKQALYNRLCSLVIFCIGSYRIVKKCLIKSISNCRYITYGITLLMPYLNVCWAEVFIAMKNLKLMLQSHSNETNVRQKVILAKDVIFQESERVKLYSEVKWFCITVSVNTFPSSPRRLSSYLVLDLLQLKISDCFNPGLSHKFKDLP